MPDFYFGEMEMRRLASSTNRFARRFYSLTAWYGLVSGYGERWVRALGWFVGLVVLCGALYLVVGLDLKVIESDAIGVMRTRLQPIGLVVQTVELALGPLFLALAALAVRRQFQR